MLTLSIVANLCLVIFIGFLLLRAKSRILAEKLATFAGCIAAITGGLGYDDRERQANEVSLALARIRNPMSRDEISWMLPRASLFRILRAEVAVDILGEHARLLMLECVKHDGSHQEVFDYIEQWQAGMTEVREKFGDAGLATAQFQIEAKLLAMYRASINADALKLL